MEAKKRRSETYGRLAEATLPTADPQTLFQLQDEVFAADVEVGVADMRLPWAHESRKSGGGNPGEWRGGDGATSGDRAVMVARLGDLPTEENLTAQIMVPAAGVGLVDGSLLAGRAKSLDGQLLKYADASGVVRSVAAEVTGGNSPVP